MKIIKIILLFVLGLLLISCNDGLKVQGFNNANRGKVAYVSKNGHNSLAQLGNPDRPFAHPWAAVAAVPDSGWRIEVLPGVYTAGDSIENPDYYSNSGDYNLIRNGLTINLQEGVTITSLDSLLPSLFTDTLEDLTFSLTGKGDIIWGGQSSIWSSGPSWVHLQYQGSTVRSAGTQSKLRFEFNKMEQKTVSVFFITNESGLGITLKELIISGKIISGKYSGIDTYDSWGIPDYKGSYGRNGDDRGFISIDVDRFECLYAIGISDLFNYDVFIKAGNMECPEQGLSLSSLRDVCAYADIERIEYVYPKDTINYVGYVNGVRRGVARGLSRLSGDSVTTMVINVKHINTAAGIRAGPEYMSGANVYLNVGLITVDTLNTPDNSTLTSSGISITSPTGSLVDFGKTTFFINATVVSNDISGNGYPVYISSTTKLDLFFDKLTVLTTKDTAIASAAPAKTVYSGDILSNKPLSGHISFVGKTPTINGSIPVPKYDIKK